MLLEDIEKQTRQPQRVELYVPTHYQARNLGTIDLTSIPQDIQVLEADKDYGPATKVLPAAMRYRDFDNVVLIYCDDDRRYDKQWIERLLSTHDSERKICASEHTTLIHRQLTLSRYYNRRRTYQVKRALSLGLWRPKNSHPEYRIAAGFEGVAISPGWLSTDALGIPKEFMPVDDIWLSGMLVKNGVNIQQTSRLPSGSSKPKIDGDIHYGDVEGLAAARFDDQDRIQLDARCIRYFQSEFGIWL